MNSWCDYMYIEQYILKIKKQKALYIFTGNKTLLIIYIHIACPTRITENTLRNFNQTTLTLQIPDYNGVIGKSAIIVKPRKVKQMYLVITAEKLRRQFKRCSTHHHL